MPTAIIAPTPAANDSRQRRAGRNLDEQGNYLTIVISLPLNEQGAGLALDPAGTATEAQAATASEEREERRCPVQ